MPRTFRQWQLAQGSRNSRRLIERHKPMGYVKGLWVVCGENVWIKFSSKMGGMYSGSSASTQLTSIRNDPIKAYVSAFQMITICQDQSQPAGESDPGRSWVDCITVIRGRLI